MQRLQQVSLRLAREKTWKRKVANAMSSGCVGELHCSTTRNWGGELTILTHLRDVEEVIYNFIKSIATVDTWRNRDNFIQVWNETHFPGESEMSIRRFIRLCWKTEDYILVGIGQGIMKGKLSGSLNLST